MKTRKYIPALGAFFVLIALAVSGCGSSTPGDTVAVVAGNPISTTAFKHWMYVAAKQQAAQSPGQPVIVPNDPPNFSKCIAQVRAQIPALKSTKDAQIKADCKQLFTSLSSQVMDFLIRAYWYQADAHKLHIKLTNAQVQAALNTARKGQFSTAAQFQAFLKTTGQTLADVTYRIRVQQIYAKLLARHPTTVTPAQISAYYAAHQSSFGTPQTRDMRIVLTKTAAQAAAARKALSKGQSFAKVAKQYSIDPTTKNKGGLLTNVTAGQQDSALSTAAFAPSATVGKLIGPIKGQFGYYIVEITKITPAKQRSLAQSTALIKQTLTTQLQTAAQNAVNNQAKQNWQSKTNCSSAYAMADCSGYKAPKTSTAGAAGAAVPRAPPAPPQPPPRSRMDPAGERGAHAVTRLDAITRRLRRECPWDREQDERTIVPHTVEEAYELADAAHRRDDAKLLDELGDVLFQVHFLSLLLEERGAGDLAAVAEHVTQKLIRRHPHVFGEAQAETAGEVLANWDAIKRDEPGREPGIFGEVPENLPAPPACPQGPAPGRLHRI